MVLNVMNFPICIHFRFVYLWRNGKSVVLNAVLGVIIFKIPDNYVHLNV